MPSVLPYIPMVGQTLRSIGGHEMNSTSLRSSVHLGAVPPAAYVSSQGFKGAYTILTCVYERVDLYLNASGIILT